MIDEDEFDPDAEAKKNEAEMLALEEAKDLEPREYEIGEFLFDTVQGAFWNTATAKLISAKGVDHLFERDAWVRYNEKQQRPSETVCSRRLTVVDDATWAPGHPMVIRGMMTGPGGLEKLKGGRLYNAYRAPEISKPKKGATADVWLDLVRLLFPEQTDFFLDCCAHMVQKPGEKLGTGFVLAGGQGTGKDTILWPLKYAVGICNTASIGPDALFEKFNPWVKTVMLNVNELRCLEQDRQASKLYNLLKPLTDTNHKTMMVNEKRDKQYTAISVARVFITTNEPDAMFLPQEDRRWLILQCSLVRKETKACTDAFYAEYERIGEDLLRAITYYLRGRDISDFRPEAEPPMTSAKRAMFENYGVDPESLAGKAFRLLRNDNGGEMPLVLFAKQMIEASKRVIKTESLDVKPLISRTATFALKDLNYTAVPPPTGRTKWRPGNATKKGEGSFEAVQGFRLAAEIGEKEGLELLQNLADALGEMPKDGKF